MRGSLPVGRWSDFQFGHPVGNPHRLQDIPLLPFVKAVESPYAVGITLKDDVLRDVEFLPDGE
eukprot:4933980-Prorocentrum_lima.AAC.1